MVSYGRLTTDFIIDVFAKTRWLFPYGVTFLLDAQGTCCFILSASLCKTLMSIVVYMFEISNVKNLPVLLVACRIFGKKVNIISYKALCFVKVWCQELSMKSLIQLVTH